ncbi:uncharacterized protein LOC135500853 [Lineus longissimus]|uniref:uncharacterized protein LOC135500842 n=1 Tax=Lineus longissimus TaxID=88925 RepID=UPI00315DBB3B
MSQEGVICVGGRLKYAPIPEEAKHQMLLPKLHPVSTCIVGFYHELSCHVLSLVRQKFWIIDGRRVAAKVGNDCMLCRKLRASLQKPMMADLPWDRVTPDKPPWTYVGVDCFGPFSVKNGRSIQKRYGCIFTCLCLRAIHLEVLASMDTDSFLNAMQRFIARRGKPARERSDNGSNFSAGEREMRRSVKEWNQHQIETFLQQRDIEWQFNTPTASHMGGVWERQIRSVRNVLQVIMIEQTVTDEQLTTTFCSVEAIINGRPLIPLSEDPTDLEPITPNHLLLLMSGPYLPPGRFVR